MSSIDLQIIQKKLYEKLKPSGWGDKLKLFLLSDSFYNILEVLWEESSQGKKFTPVLKDLFNAFEKCPYKDLSVVIVGQEPYPKAGAADGMAFSCSTLEQPMTSLKYILQEVQETTYEKPYPPMQLDLTHWANQGVLLLNTSLTTQIGKTGVHVKLWEPFINYVFDMLSHYNPGTIYVFMGNDAKEWSKVIPTNNFKFFTLHPASAAYMEKGRWNSGDCFNQINKILKNNNNIQIKW